MNANQIQAEEYKAKLESFRDLFKQYAEEVFGERRGDRLDELRTKLQRLSPQTTGILLEILGNATFGLGHAGESSTRALLIRALMGGNNEIPHNFSMFAPAVNSQLETALGTLEAGLWPPTQARPVLVVKDNELKERCTDLLAAPGNFDRVIREATLVLEDRIRRKVPHEVLARLIPNAADQIGENLVNRVFSPNNPILVFSSDRTRRIALHKMLAGVVSYLRNPAHHQLDPSLEWSWAWSTVGLIDRLLLDIESSTFDSSVT